MNYRYFFAAFLLLVSFALSAQPPIPGKKQSMPVLIKGGTIHVGNGQVINNGEIRFANGKIVYAGPSSDVNTADAQVIDATGKHVYPGLILTNTILGLVEIDAARPTRDYEETGDVNPNARALIAYNTDSEIIPTVRANGILLAQIAPRGGVISGSSSVVQLDAWNWEDAAYKPDDGIYLNWPLSFIAPAWWSEEQALRRNERATEVKKAIREILEDGQTYTALAKPNPVNLRLEAMKGLYDGSKTMFIRVNGAKDMIEAVQTVREYGVQKVVLVGAAEAWAITDFIKENNVAVLIDETFNLPRRADEDVDMPFKLASVLQKAGILYGFTFSGSTHSVRNLPFSAGMAAGNGLTKEEALMSVTLNNAKILGIDKVTGSLEVGKDANIVISEGDILDMKSSKVTHAFIQGRALDLNNKHLKLYERFKTKYSDDK